MPSFFDRPRNASDDVRRLIASLYNPDPLVRADACEKLQERADAEPAMPYLLGLLYDDTVAWNPMALSTDPRTEVGNEAAMALANIGGPAVQPLITIMGSNAPIRVRTRAARGLGYARAQPAIPALVRALDTNDAMLHHVCIQALQAITFERFTEDQDWRDWLKKQTPPATSPASQPGKA